MPTTPAARRDQAARAQVREIDRRIVALALPSLGTLLVQPLLLIVDSAMVGHLGTAPLAALALATTIVSTITGLCVFLAYATTSTASRLMGAGKHKQAISAGLDGMWLGALLGALLFAVLLLGASPVVSWFSPSPDVAIGATTYLRLISPGLVGMLLALAATGALRGMLDARTPLWVATAGAVVNVPLNYLFIYGLDMGVGGAGLGTAVTEMLMAVALALAVARAARRHQVSLLPKFGGVLASAKDGWPLFVRTLSMRVAMLAAVWGATVAGEVTLAGYQVVNSVWNLAAFGLDALAIAAQALTGKAIGAGDTALLRATLRRSTQWATRSGALVGAAMLVLSPWLPLIFGAHLAPSAASPGQGQWWAEQWAALFAAGSVHASATWALALAGPLFPLASYVFILDGVLIGAGDGRYLAKAGLVILSIHLPALAGLTWLSRQVGEPWALSLLTLGFAGVFMVGRALANGRRAATSDWY
ncbi:MAG: MATE family efflux transporter [Buchananella hordeovulneris]|nr:MATE family efflux transporter [Buchananella hordeovulneris]